jgi:hypothetical protein
MPADFPLWRLRPEEAARIIILEPQQKVERHKFWRKREMRIRPSKRSAPRVDSDRFLAMAKDNKYWGAYKAEHQDEFPVLQILHGPLMADGRFFSYRDKIWHPLGGERQREPWAGTYSREQYECDWQYLEEARALLRENFILGQRGEGPYLDGIVFMRADSLLEAEQLRCKNRLQMTWALIEASRAARRQASPKEGKPEYWHNIGLDETTAMAWKQRGHQIRKIDTLTDRHYEVKIT